MKNFKYLIIVLLVSGVFLSCQKARPERYPTVRIVSVDHDTGNDILTIVGEVVDDGGEEIESTGFCVSPYDDFYREDIFRMAERDGNRFEFTYDFDEIVSDNSLLLSQSTLYIYAYAVNRNGFGISEAQTTDE